MLVTELISLIQSDNPDIEVPKILIYLNQVQDLMLSKAIPYTKMIDPTTGKDYTIEFDGSSVEYEISAVNGFSDDARFIEKVYNNNGLLKCDLFEATDFAGAKIRVPLTVNGTYSISCYRKPRKILNPNSPIDIPSRYHLDTVYEGVLGYIEREQYGVSERLQYFKIKLLPKFWNDQTWTDTNNDCFVRSYE